MAYNSAQFSVYDSMNVLFLFLFGSVSTIESYNILGSLSVCNHKNRHYYYQTIDKNDGLFTDGMRWNIVQIKRYNSMLFYQFVQNNKCIKIPHKK